MMMEFRTGLDEVQQRRVDIKIEQGKHYFLEGVTKSGKNNYQKFNYIELSDIIPTVRQICRDLKMKTKVEFSEEVATLTITDCEDGSSSYFTCPIPRIDDQDPGKFMQNVGKVRTYATRYLYIQAFEIAVPDEIDKNSKGTTITKRPYKNNRQNTTSFQKTPRDLHDLARKIAEEMTSKGIPDTVENVLAYMKEEWKQQHLSPQEYRELKALVEAE